MALNRVLWKLVPELVYATHRINVIEYLFKVIQRIDAVFAHFCDESDAGNENSMIFLGDQAAGSRQKHLHQLWHASDDPKGTECRFLPDVRVW